MKQRFYKFVKNSPIMLERRKYMALNSIRHNDETELPRSVNNFLNMVPPEHRTIVLKWIITKGMRQASVARRFVTQKYSKQYGLDIGQDQLFSQRSYENDPKLDALKNQIEQDWFDQDMEPRYIDIRGHARRIDAYQINAHLEEMGLEPMYFGGSNGLLEKIEQGEWVTDDLHNDSRDDKQGHDLSLADGDHGIHGAERKEIESLRKQIKDAEDSEDYAEADRLTDKLMQLSSDAKSGGNLTRLGVGKIGGFIPSVNDDNYANSISRSARDSRDTIHRLYDDIKAGKVFDELDGEEAAYLQKLRQNGEITSEKRSVVLKKIMGIIKRTLPPADLQVEDTENIMYSKAIIKAVFKDLLSRDPSNPGDGYGVWPTTNPALGLDSTGVLPPATVVVYKNEMYDHKGHKITLDGKNAPTPENIDAIADTLTDWMVDDEKGLTAIKIRISRGTLPISGGGSKRYILNIEHHEFFSGRVGTKTQQALAKLEKNQIEVNFKGQRVSADPEIAMQKVQGQDQTMFNVQGKTVDPLDHKSSTVPIKPEELKNVLKGYELIGKNRKGNILTYEIPNTGIRKQIIVSIGADGQKSYAEYKPTEDNTVDDDIKNPNNKVKEFGNGRYASITFPDGRKILARRSIDPQGNDVWNRVKDARTSTDQNTLLHPIKVKVNSGLTGQRTQMRGSDEKTHAMWQDFLDNSEDFGEPKPPKGGVPEFISHALNANRSNGTDLIDAQAELMNQINNVSFKFGDFEKKDVKGRKTDVYDLLGEILSPEEVQKIIPMIKKMLLENPGHHNGERTLVSHDGKKDNRLFVSPNSVRDDVYQALLKNGYLWRVRKASSIIRTDAGTKKGKGAFGTGGKDSDEVQNQDLSVDQLKKQIDKYRDAEGNTDWARWDKDQNKATSTEEDGDKYDDELYSADDQDDILAKPGDDTIDPSLAGLNAVNVDKTTGANYADRIASPQGTKRDVSKMYSLKIGDKEYKNFIVGRQRSNINATHSQPSNDLDAPYDDLNAPDAPSNDLDAPYDDLDAPYDDLDAPYDDLDAPYDDLDAPYDDLDAPYPQPSDILNKPNVPTTHVAPHTNDVRPNNMLGVKKEHTTFKRYDKWLLERSAVYDPNVKVKDGCGFNWWGAAGNPLGVSISGKADTSKSDPTGRENRARRSRTSGK